MMQRDSTLEKQPSLADIGHGNEFDNNRLVRYNCENNNRIPFSSQKEQTCLGLQSVIDARQALWQLCDPPTGAKMEGTGTELHRLSRLRLPSNTNPSNPTSNTNSVITPTSSIILQQLEHSMLLDSDGSSCLDTIDHEYLCTDDMDMEVMSFGDDDDIEPIEFTCGNKEGLPAWEDAMHTIFDNDTTPMHEVFQDIDSTTTQWANHHHILQQTIAREESDNSRFFNAIAANNVMFHETIDDDLANDAMMTRHSVPCDKVEESNSVHLQHSQAQSSERLRRCMIESCITQEELQNWDRKRGLPASHSRTMVNSARSRKQLLEGVLLRKWNGVPLVNIAIDDDNNNNNYDCAPWGANATAHNTSNHWDCDEWFQGMES